MAKITMGQKDKGKTHHLQPFTDTNTYVVRTQIQIQLNTNTNTNTNTIDRCQQNSDNNQKGRAAKGLDRTMVMMLKMMMM